MCRAREKVESSASSLACRCWTVEGPPLFQDWGGYSGPNRDGQFVPGLTMGWCLPLSTHAWTWWGQTAESAVCKAAPMNFTLCSPRISHRGSVSHAPCSHLANGPLNLTWQVTFSIFILLSSALSLLNLYWCPKCGFVKVFHSSTKVLPPSSGAYRLCQGQLNLAMFIKSASRWVCIFIIPML